MSAAVAAQDDGLTWEEYRRNVPPAPAALHVEMCGGRVMLLWEMPEAAPAADQLAYDPVIARYRVFRVGPGRDLTLAGETKATFFWVPAPLQGHTDYYAVKAVQRSGQESGLSADVAVPGF